MSLIQRLWARATPAEGGGTGPGADASLESAYDFRGLPAPEPMVRALAAADALPPGASVAVLTPLMPAPLLELLAARGLVTDSRELLDGGVMTLIHCPREHVAQGQDTDIGTTGN